MIHLCPIGGGRLSDRERGQVYPYMYMFDPNCDKFTSRALNRKHNVGFLKVQNGGDRGDGDKFCPIWYVSDLQGTKFYPIWDMSDLQGGFRRSSKNTGNRMSVA